MELTFDAFSSSEFKVAQFHVHSPSEHQIDGKNMDLEMHFVHTYMDGSLGAVIGVFFDRAEGGDGDNLFLNQLEGIFTATGNTRTNQKINVEGFLDSLNKDDFWSYDGSLTTPPCTEGIKWTVLKTVQPISEAQLAKYTALWAGNAAYAEGKGNNRVIQSHGDRTIKGSNWAPDGYLVSAVILSVLFGITAIACVGVLATILCCPKKYGFQKKTASK
jgi:carbonic anhydrase